MKQKILLHEWQRLNPSVFVELHNHGLSKQVFSQDPVLWHLSDWVVTATAPGPSVILIPRIPS